jgi:hypothetical protein
MIIKGPTSFVEFKSKYYKKKLFLFGDIHIIEDTDCDKSIDIFSFLNEMRKDKKNHIILELDKTFDYSSVPESYLCKMKTFFRNKKNVIMCDYRRRYEHLFTKDSFLMWKRIFESRFFLKRLYKTPINIRKKILEFLSDMIRNEHNIMIQSFDDGKNKEDARIRYTSIIFDIFLLVEIFDSSRENIVVYTGESHISRLKKFLRILKFELVSTAISKSFQCLEIF